MYYVTYLWESVLNQLSGVAIEDCNSIQLQYVSINLSLTSYMGLPAYTSIFWNHQIEDWLSSNLQSEAKIFRVIFESMIFQSSVLKVSSHLDNIQSSGKYPGNRGETWYILFRGHKVGLSEIGHKHLLAQKLYNVVFRQ